VFSLGTLGYLLTGTPGSAASILGVASSVGHQISQSIAPLELVTIYGIGIGPPAALIGRPDSNGVIGDSLGGYQVLFNGAPAPLLYASSSQINLIVPASIANSTSTSIQIVKPEGTLAVPPFSVVPWLPVIFSDISNSAAPALNQDGTLNSPANPAAAGSIVAIWLTGIGSATGADNMINIPAPRQSNLPVRILGQDGMGRDDVPEQVLYAGDAPEQPSGVSQINFRLPPKRSGSPAYEKFFVSVGAVVSDVFYIWVK
ncbi:MAG: hypothetical protein ABJC09_17565, partial [Terriglobia bacterium]